MSKKSQCVIQDVHEESMDTDGCDAHDFTMHRWSQSNVQAMACHLHLVRANSIVKRLRFVLCTSLCTCFHCHQMRRHPIELIYHRKMTQMILTLLLSRTCFEVETYLTQIELSRRPALKEQSSQCASAFTLPLQASSPVFPNRCYLRLVSRAFWDNPKPNEIRSAQVCAQPHQPASVVKPIQEPQQSTQHEARHDDSDGREV
eukprot:568239-Amphidinium_carterae.1